MEHTLLIFKPDSVENDRWITLLGLLSRVMIIREVHMHTMTRLDCRVHYAEHVNKGFYANHEDFMVSGPSVFVVAEGEIAMIRNSVKALRDLYDVENPRNMVHASDSKESADRELSYWCKKFNWP